MKLDDGKRLINDRSRQNAASGETGGVPCLLLVSRGPHFDEALRCCDGGGNDPTESAAVRKGLVRLISQLRRPQGLAHLKLLTDTGLNRAPPVRQEQAEHSQSTAAFGRSAAGQIRKSWYEYRYASSSLGTLQREFLMKFAWAVGGSASHTVGKVDDAGSQHEETINDDGCRDIWTKDSYVERAVVHQPRAEQEQSAEQEHPHEEPEDEVLNWDSSQDADPVLVVSPPALMETGEEGATREIYENTKPFPPMKVVWPSDQQMKGYEEPKAESEGSQPEWLTSEKRADTGVRIRSSFMLTGSDQAFTAVEGQVEAVRAETQFGRDAALSHSKVLSCHLCSDADEEDAEDAAAARSMDTDGGSGGGGTYDNDDLLWVYVGSANFSQAAWGGALGGDGAKLTKKEKEAQAGLHDTVAGVHSLPWW